MNNLNMHTQDMSDANIEKIGDLFPNCLTERVVGKDKDGNDIIGRGIDFDRLRQELSKEIVEGPQERYQFTWPGKREAMRLANTPTNMTLRPDRKSSVDFDNTENLYIEGDNLEVLKLLREDYLGKVKMIYIDPPYNTGGDFLYNDDYSETTNSFLEKSGLYDEQGNLVINNYEINTDSNGRFHSDWLNMMYPRIKVARDLLSEDGVLFISIDDNEQDNLKKICNEIFGGSSFVTTLHVEMSATQGMKVKAAQNGNIVKNGEYILVYSKDGHKNIAQTILYDYRPEYDGHYSKFLNDDMTVENLIDVFNRKYPQNKIDNIVSDYDSSPLFKQFVEENLSKIFRYDKTTGFNSEDFELNKVVIVQRKGRSYHIERKSTGVEQLMFLSASYGFADNFRHSYGLRKIRGDWWKEFYLDMGNVSKEGDIAFANGKKPVRLLSQLCKMCTTGSDIVLDFFSGSATTAHAVMTLNKEDHQTRRFILVQLPATIEDKNSDFVNICELGKERMRRSGTQLKPQKSNNDNSLFSIDSNYQIDTGFRVLKLDTSNMQDVYYKPEESSDATLFEDNVKPDRTSEDLLFQVMLECNLPLSAKIEKKTFSGKEVFNVNDGYLLACFDEDVNETVITEVAKQKPYYFIMRDKSLSSDNVADNFEQIFNAYSKDTIRKIL